MKRGKVYNICSGTVFLSLLIFLVVLPAASQNLRMVKMFTVNEGLASNLVYSCMEDSRGFLWVGTDNGVCRFDGKYFKRYAQPEGVPDNDVLEVIRENDGTIWINTFKQGPCYYDEAADRFVNPLKDAGIPKDIIKLVLWGKRLDEGGVVFFNTAGELVFKNRKLVPSAAKVANRFYEGSEPYWLYTGKTERSAKEEVYVYLKSRNRVDSLSLFVNKEKKSVYEISGVLKNKLYLLQNTGKIYIVQKKEGRDPFRVVTQQIDENPILIRKNGNDVNISTVKGSIYVFDFVTDTLRYRISGSFFANSTFRDSEGNVWVATVDKGLILFRKSSFNMFRPFGDPPTRNNFRSVFVDQNGTLFGGNNYGEIVERTPGNRLRFHNISETGSGGRVLGMLVSQNKFFVMSEGGGIIDFKRRILLENSEPLRQLKRGMVYNDSVLIVTGVDPRGGLYKVNTITERARRLKIPWLRITTLVAQGRYIYLGTTEGLFRYDYETGALSETGSSTPLKGSRILSTAVSPDGLLWVSTINNGVFVLKNNTVVYQVSDPGFLNFSVMKLQETDRPGALWATTRRGAAYISYSIRGGKFSYTITNLNHEEGVSNNVISDIFYRKDSIYLAAESGIAVIPSNMTVPRFDIKTYLTDIKVNQKPLRVDSSYDLPSGDRALTLTFSGANISGYFDHFIYSLNEDSSTSEIVGNTLNLQLEPGRHVLKVRAVNVNGLVSRHVLVLRFNLRGPFYRSAWFVFIVASLATGLSFLGLNRLKTIRQKRKQAQRNRIETERNRITEDLHDDIGSTLSSLKVYSDVASSLMERDVSKTKYLLEQISVNSSKILEDIGDIIWSMRTDKQNMLTVDSRIKNFVSEMLGSREIDYHIQIAPGINDMVQHMTARKNVVLIVKEAVNNIVKYSQASHVSIHIYKKEEMLRIEIVDNGIGFYEDAKPTGNGLRNMKKRTEELGGVFQIAGFPGKGTKINAAIPVTNISDKGV
ncbi:sensor histidine kinase [Niabella drilacis]|uniref:Signal transduction histidine kinase n=1 Tax=Niabella drilacis (strain DSM 25811 / CCM 8410 / CCUG 62505 / LMG 26954 / E90) TaxID=1285928 RepID=A0A1G7AVW7_NIADE|nr:two-component regulator propeller domain-containing protein [Niabella drilacis]SDE18921.1 Signal transduction histidine kinase [Niabella drilacis]